MKKFLIVFGLVLGFASAVYADGHFCCDPSLTKDQCCAEKGKMYCPNDNSCRTRCLKVTPPECIGGCINPNGDCCAWCPSAEVCEKIGKCQKIDANGCYTCDVCASDCPSPKCMNQDGECCPNCPRVCPEGECLVNVDGCYECGDCPTPTPDDDDDDDDDDECPVSCGDWCCQKGNVCGDKEGECCNADKTNCCTGGTHPVSNQLGQTTCCSAGIDQAGGSSSSAFCCGAGEYACSVSNVENKIACGEQGCATAHTWVPNGWITQACKPEKICKTWIEPQYNDWWTVCCGDNQYCKEETYEDPCASWDEENGCISGSYTSRYCADK